MSEKLHQNPIIVVGMARSGTTLISHILGSLPNAHIEVEPHALWKSGNFHYHNDEEFEITPKIVNNIRAKFNAESYPIFIEKSPNNSLKPTLVHAVFPNAKIVYIERDAVRCIHSNYKRSVKKDSFKLSIILKKYFVSTGTDDLPGAVSNRTLFQQISLSDLPAFIRYTIKMFWLRSKDNLPFGPKLKDFAKIHKERGLLGYHVEVYKASQRYKAVYKELYGDNMAEFKMEGIMQDVSEIERLMAFINVDIEEKWMKEIQATLDGDRITEAKKPAEIDKQIIELLKS
jgi:hypothetical protein